MPGGVLAKELGEEAIQARLLMDTFGRAARGSAGQSFGAFLSKGVTLTLEGDANGAPHLTTPVLALFQGHDANAIPNRFV